MIKLNQLKSPQEFRQGQTIVSVDRVGAKSVEQIECLDNGKMFTKCLITGDTTPKECGEPVEHYFDSYYYNAVFEVLSE